MKRDLSPQEVNSLSRVHRALAAAPPGTFVVVGGWAARLLRRHPLARPPQFDPLTTADFDLAGPARVSQGHGPWRQAG
jgi:hypothetical protein